MYIHKSNENNNNNKNVLMFKLALWWGFTHGVNKNLGVGSETK